jgi:hypothetical protein
MRKPAFPSIRSPSLIAMMVSGWVLLVSCVSAPGPSVKGSSTNPYRVTINFESKCTIRDVVPETTECKGKDHKDFCIARGNHVTWTGNKLFDDTDGRAIEYVIFFDPVVRGRKYRSRNGVVSRRMQGDAPLALYKYSILASPGCAADTDTFDPHIRVDR